MSAFAVSAFAVSAFAVSAFAVSAFAVRAFAVSAFAVSAFSVTSAERVSGRGRRRRFPHTTTSATGEKSRQPRTDKPRIGRHDRSIDGLFLDFRLTYRLFCIYLIVFQITQF